MSMRDAFRQAGLRVSDESNRRDDMPGTPDERQSRGQSRSGQQGRGRQGRGGGQHPSQNAALPEFPNRYFEPDERGNPCLRTDFVSRNKVDRMAKVLANANPRLTTGQIRRFFNHCREIERRLNDGESWKQVASDFESLCSHAQYASSGQNRKIPREFCQFIDSNVKRVGASDDPHAAFLRGFLPHFEALVGFGAAYMKDR